MHHLCPKVWLQGGDKMLYTDSIFVNDYIINDTMLQHTQMHIWISVKYESKCMHQFTFKKIYLKLSSAKRRPFSGSHYIDKECRILLNRTAIRELILISLDTQSTSKFMSPLTSKTIIQYLTHGGGLISGMPYKHHASSGIWLSVHALFPWEEWTR